MPSYFLHSIHLWTEQKGKAKQKLKSSGKWKLCRLEGSAIRLPTPTASKTGSNQVAASFAAWLNIHSKWETLSPLDYQITAAVFFSSYFYNWKIIQKNRYYSPPLLADD